MLHSSLHGPNSIRLATAPSPDAVRLRVSSRAEATLGSVEAGRVADLVLLDANPLEDIAHTRRIRAVVVNGRPFDRAALDSLLARVESLARR